jgi:NTE family protein
VGGTSIGSIVSGLYAIGYHPDTMLKLIREQDWDKIMTDQIDRKYIAYEEKEYGETYILSLPINKNGITLKEALYEGQEVNLFMNRYYSPGYKTRDFSKFQTPFLCIGTELLTGDAIVLDTGYLPMAIRSSMSLPGYFTPTYYDGMYLIDGGVVDNFPVAAVKNKGVPYVLGANVWQGLATSMDELNTMTAVVGQLINYAAVDNNDKGIRLTDMYIPFKMKYTVMDFAESDSIIALGEKVGRDHYAEIKALADSLNAFEFKPVKEYKTVPLDSVYISAVIVTGNKRVPQKYFDNTFKKFENSWVTFNELEEEIRKAYGSRFFNHIFYELRWDGNNTTLIFNIKEADAGYVSAGIHYDNDYSASILLNGSFRNIIGKGTKIFTQLVVGPNPRFRALFLKDNGDKPGYGGKIDMYYFGWDEYASQTNSNSQTGRIFFTNYTASLFASSIIKNKYDFKIGGTYEYFRFKSKTEGVIEDSISNFNSYGDFFFSFNSDTRDRSYFSTKGVKSELKAVYVMPLSKDWVNELLANSLVIWLNYEQSIPLSKKITLKPGLFLGATYSKNYPYSANVDKGSYSVSPVQHWFYMGGQAQSNYLPTFQPFTGVQFVQKYGFYQAVFRMKAQYNFYDKMYFTLAGDLGSNELYLKDIFQGENLVVGYGGTASYDSFIGPIEISVMGSNIYRGASFFISLGFWF